MPLFRSFSRSWRRSGRAQESLKPGGLVAEDSLMTCSRCSEPGKVRRGDHNFCGACAIAFDWQQVIHLLQDARVESPVAGSPSLARTA
ncbi:MAG: hypothetical protein QY307_05925 [Acidimicrobiia bacterium]|nr:MAG: hypothetical protein QY307_05925 [Acidimicrobiia bacterium]